MHTYNYCNLILVYFHYFGDIHNNYVIFTTDLEFFNLLLCVEMGFTQTFLGTLNATADVKYICTA